MDVPMGGTAPSVESLPTDGRTAIPIVIGGFYRSGTSLVRRLLDSHSRIHCGPEVTFFRDFYGRYSNDEMAHVRFFSTVRSLGLGEGELLRLFGTAFVTAHQRAASAAGKARWADKNPDNAIFLREWDVLVPDGFLFINVIRNPLDVLASLKEVGFPRTIPVDFHTRVELYAHYRRAAADFQASEPGRCYSIEYDSLVTNPLTALREVFDFLEEEFEPSVVDSYWRPDRGVGLEDPKIAKTREIHPLSVGRWRRDLTPSEIGICRAELGDWL